MAGVLAAVAGCAGSPSSGTAASPTPAMTEVLAVREATGGLCPSGPCAERLEVLRDGTWASSDEAGPVGSDASVTCGDSVADGPDITYTWYAESTGRTMRACHSDAPELAALLDDLAAEAG